MAKPIRKTEFAGTGCVIQGVGLLVAVAGFALGIGLIGVIAGVALFVLGSVKSGRWVCPACRNPLLDRDVKICPTCKAELG